MAKLRVLSGEEVCRILEGHGFRCVRQRGSHRIMQKRESETTVSVPVPMHSRVRQGTLMSIIRQTGLPRSLFQTEP